MKKELTKIDNIKDMWLNKIYHKKKFMLIVAEDLNKKLNTLRQRWFCSYGDWSIPEENLDRVIELMQNWIKQHPKPKISD